MTKMKELPSYCRHCGKLITEKTKCRYQNYIHKEVQAGEGQTGKRFIKREVEEVNERPQDFEEDRGD